MKLVHKASLLMLFLVGTSALSQELQPLELIKTMMTDNEFVDHEFYPKLTEYATADYLSSDGHPNVTDIQSGDGIKNMKLTFKLLNQLENRAVVNVEVRVPNNGLAKDTKTLDTYFHLQKIDNEWKVSAFRYLAMTGTLQKMYDTLSTMSDAEINDFLANDVSETMKTRADFDFYVNNLKLVLASDDELTEHFLAHKSGFERIAKQVMDKNQTDIEIADKSLLITEIVFDELLDERTISFVIGGVLDNTVGYLYVPKDVLPPQPYENYLIMLRSIGDGWYLYKTT